MNKGLMRYVLGAVFAAGVAILTGAGISGYSRSVADIGCNSLEVRFEGGEPFLNAQDILELLEEQYGVFVGQRIRDISLSRVERILDASGPIRRSEAWMTGDGILHVSVWQREPLLRFTDGRDGFYIDAEGTLFPLVPTHQAAVPVVYGPRPAEEEAWPSAVEQTVAYLRANDFAADSLQCNAGGELTLIGAQGEQILLGRPGRIGVQVPLLGCYCERIAPVRPGYKSINLKYNKQIICRKDI